MIKELIQMYHLEGTIIDKAYQKTFGALHAKMHEKKVQTAMNAYGLEALDKIYQAVKANGSNIWFEYGTLLGAYREHGFIPYDYDIDLGMYANQFTPELERALFNEGFVIKRFFYKVVNQDPSERVMTELTLIYKNVSIDIFFYFVEDDNRIGFVYSALWGQEMLKKNILAPIKTTLPNSSIKEIDFLGIKFGIPSNTKQCLETLYGKTFMTPIKDASYTKKKECLPIEQAYGEMIGTW